MRTTWLYLLFPTLFLLSTCGSSGKLERPQEKYDERVADGLSIVNIPVNIEMRQLEQMLNRQLNVLYEDNDINDGDKMMLRAVKNGDLRLHVDSQKIKYTVPLILWINYDAGLTNVQADGEIILDMATEFEIQSDWNILTKTELVDYQWEREPKLRMGMVSLPVGSLLNVVIRNGRSYLTREIDELIKENLRLQETLDGVWKQMFDPIIMSEEFNTWLTVNPKRLAMTPLLVEQDKLSTTITIESYPEIKVGEAPERHLLAPPLPPLQFVQQSKDNFLLNITTEVSYEEAERIAKEQMLGETYSSGKHSVTVEDIELYGSGNNLVVNTILSGSYAGNVYMEGEPVYNARKNRVEIEDLDFTLDTKNFLHRSASWILKGTIRRNIEENLKFLLDYNLADMKTQVQQQIGYYELMPGVAVEGNLEELNIRNVYLSPNAIMVNIGLAGKVDLNIKMTEE